MWTACGWSPKEIGKASTRISITAISFPNYSNAYTVLELFAGSGTTLFAYENLRKDYIGFDITQKIIDYVNSIMSEWSSINYAIKNVDVTDRQPFSEAIAA